MKYVSNHTGSPVNDRSAKTRQEFLHGNFWVDLATDKFNDNKTIFFKQKREITINEKKIR